MKHSIAVHNEYPDNVQWCHNLHKQNILDYSNIQFIATLGSLWHFMTTISSRKQYWAFPFLDFENVDFLQYCLVWQKYSPEDFYRTFAWHSSFVGEDGCSCHLVNPFFFCFYYMSFPASFAVITCLDYPLKLCSHQTALLYDCPYYLVFVAFEF